MINMVVNLDVESINIIDFVIGVSMLEKKLGRKNLKKGKKTRVIHAI